MQLPSIGYIYRYVPQDRLWFLKFMILKQGYYFCSWAHIMYFCHIFMYIFSNVSCIHFYRAPKLYQLKFYCVICSAKRKPNSMPDALISQLPPEQGVVFGFVIALNMVSICVYGVWVELKTLCSAHLSEMRATPWVQGPRLPHGPRLPVIKSNYTYIISNHHFHTSNLKVFHFYDHQETCMHAVHLEVR